jgi:hypothetical protein
MDPAWITFMHTNVPMEQLARQQVVTLKIWMEMDLF